MKLPNAAGHPRDPLIGRDAKATGLEQNLRRDLRSAVDKVMSDMSAATCSHIFHGLNRGEALRVATLLDALATADEQKGFPHHASFARAKAAFLRSQFPDGKS